MYHIYHLQFDQDVVNTPNSIGEIAYPPRITFDFRFTMPPTAETSIPLSYDFQLVGMSKELKFPFELRPTVSGGIIIILFFIIHSTYYNFYF